MANENQLEDTSDSILPIKNGLGLPSEVFADIVREFSRACNSKNIEKSALVSFMGNRSSWKIKCIAIGAVSNVIISMGNDCDEQLNFLNNIGEDIVVDEIIRALINGSGDQLGDAKNGGKKSTTKIGNAKSSSIVKKKELPGAPTNQLEYRSTKSGSSVMLLTILSIVGVVLAIGGFLVFRSSGAKKAATIQVPPPVVNNETPAVIVKPKETSKSEERDVVVKPAEIKKEAVISQPSSSAKILPEGIFVYQSGQDHFLGGDLITLSSTKKRKNTSPFTVGNLKGTSYTLMRIDLSNIPTDAIVENAVLRISATTDNENNEVFNLYCASAPANWSPNTLAYNQNGGPSEIAFDSLVKDKAHAEKASINLRNDWVSFNVTGLVQEWVSKKLVNNGVVLFSESASEISFDGFDSNRKMMTPKLVITFGSIIKKKETEMKPTDSKQNNIDPGAPTNKPNLTKETKSKEDVATLPKTDKPDEIVEENDPILKNFSKKPEEPKTKEDKKSAKSILDEELSKTKENEEAPPKKAGVTGNVEKSVEKTESVKSDVAVEITMKDPLILPMSRLLETTDFVKFENPENKGELRFTIDGKEPTPDSSLYLEPIKLNGPNLHLIKVAIFLDRVRKSAVKEQEYRLVGQGQLIDNNMSACKKSGNWESSKSRPNYYGKDYIWEQKGKGTVEWIPSINKKGNCEVYIWLPDGEATTRSKETKFTIKFDGGKKEVLVDQTTKSLKWIYLGVYPMKAGSGSVFLEDDGLGKMVIADAIYFAFLNE